jgi:tetratricopeptide (TPR) repeat protein
VPPDTAGQLTLARYLRQRGEVGQARAVYEQVIKIEPKHADALNELGIVTALAGEHKKALIYFDKALAADDRHADARLNRGLALQALGATDAALENCDRAIALNAGRAEVHLQRGNLLKLANRLDEALASFDRAIELDPRYAEAYVNRGIVRNSQGALHEALADFDRALALKPDSVKAHCNRAFTQLLAGNFTEGWVEYEWRWKLDAQPSTADRQAFSERSWRGEFPIDGKTVLVYSEQGLGDTLQFCRYIPMLAELGARVILAAQQPLLPLLANLRGVCQLIARDAELPPFDYQCPLMSLPLALQTRIDTIPRAIPYLGADAARQSLWQAKLGPKTAPRIGLVWSRGRDDTTDRNRSVSLGEWLEFLPPRFQYISLQKLVSDADRRIIRANPRLAAFPADLRDFSDTAALCRCMDLVISIDTSVAHLAGALGMPTWILLPFDPGWRWLLNRSDSPWYPTATLFRQSGPGTWAAVFRSIETRLLDYFRDTV